MKKAFVLLALLAFSLGMNAQVEKIFDFNNYGSGEPLVRLNGQDGWYVRAHSAGNGGSNMGPMYTDYMGHFWGNTPVTPTADETIGVFSHASGTSFGDIATHDISEYGFDFSNGGIIEIECDVLRQWWGTLFRASAMMVTAMARYCLPSAKPLTIPLSMNLSLPDPTSTSPDGGVYMLTTGNASGNTPSDSDFITGVVLPSNNVVCDLAPAVPDNTWIRWKVSIDLDANDGAGAVTLFCQIPIAQR